MTSAPAAYDDDAALWLALNQIQGLGSQSFCQLLRAFGNPAAIYSATLKQLRTVVSEPVARLINAGPDQDAITPTLEWLQNPGNFLITLADNDYPRALLEIPDPPALFFC